MSRNIVDKAGHLVVKGLGIKVQKRDGICEEISRGESVFSMQTTETFIEEEPTSAEWVASLVPNRRDVVNYFRSLFPFTYWIGRYNLQWLIGDLVAGRNLRSILYCVILLNNYRYYHRRRCSSPRDGLCSFSKSGAPVWSLLLFHGCPHLLVLRYIERYHHRSMSIYPAL